jgi:hypothetical protein
MKRLQGFIAGIIVTSLLMLGNVVFAEPISTLFNVINININNTKVATIGDNYLLDNGEQIPFSISYKNTTYLPMRKLAEILDKDVVWDNNTKTASVNDKAEVAVESTPTPPPTSSPALTQISTPSPTPSPTPTPTPNDNSAYIAARSAQFEQDLAYIQTQIVNTKNNKNVQVLQQQEDGTWDYVYTYDQSAVDALQRQYDSKLSEYNIWKALWGV